MTSTAEKIAAFTGGRTARAVWLGIASAETAGMAALAGAEVGVVDTEHGQIGPETCAAMISALHAGGAKAITRVATTEPGRIKHALDAGADGIIVPYVETVAEAQAAVEAFCFPPLGKRGSAMRVMRAARYGADVDYGPTWNDTGLLVLQIESRRGLAAAPEIAAVAGVDMLLLGPSDFCADAGWSLGADGEKVFDAWREIDAAARAAGKGMMGFSWPAADAARLAEAGCEIVTVASDIVVLTSGLAAAVGAP